MYYLSDGSKKNNTSNKHIDMITTINYVPTLYGLFDWDEEWCWFGLQFLLIVISFFMTKYFFSKY
jgi:hypothetical protein